MSIEWNGEGLPPIGCECEFFNGQRYYARDSSPEDGQVVKIHAHVVSGAGIACAVFSWIGSDKSVMSEAAQEGLFRPTRTEKLRERDERIACLDNFISGFMKSTDGDHAHLGAAIYEWLAVLDRLK